MQVEFTDRYGGNPPSWLRGCFTCEAMGCYPELPDHINVRTGIDDWQLIDCRDCHGTGRVSWLITILRIPRWLWKGVCFIREMGFDWEMSPPGVSKVRHFLLVFKCAFLADLGLWRP